MFEVVSLLHHAFLGYECSIWVNSKWMKFGLAVWSDLVKCFCTCFCIYIYIYIHFCCGYPSYSKSTSSLHCSGTESSTYGFPSMAVQAEAPCALDLLWTSSIFLLFSYLKGWFFEGSLWNNDLLWVLKHLRRSRSWPGSCDGSGTIAVSTIALWIRIA